MRPEGAGYLKSGGGDRVIYRVQRPSMCKGPRVVWRVSEGRRKGTGAECDEGVA